MKKVVKVALLLLCLCMPLAGISGTYTIKSVPSPKMWGQDFYVSNPDTVIELITDSFLNIKLKELQQNTTVEMAVVVIDAYDYDEYYDAYDFSLQLFNYWGIGDKDTNTGLLLFLARRSREVQLITGSGLEGIMTDYACGEILDEALPYLKNNQYDAGILRIVREVEIRLMEEKNRSELLLGWRPADAQEDAEVLTGYLLMGFILLIIFGFLAYKKLNGEPGQSKKSIQDQSKKTQSCLGCLMFIFPIPLLFFYIYFRKARKNVKVTPPNCKACGHAMEKASKEAEMAKMTKPQLVEKELEACDYSLWKCPTCGAEEFLQHKGVSYNTYDVCSACGARATKLTDHTILTNATYSHKGEKLNTYTCQCCGNVTKKTVIIPKKEHYSSSSSSSSWDSSSSSSSGSWGGGHSSGGGAGRHF